MASDPMEERQAARRRLFERMREASVRHRRSVDALNSVADGWERDAAAGMAPVLEERGEPAGDGFVFAPAAERAEQARREHVQRRQRAAREVASSERLRAASRRAWPV